MKFLLRWVLGVCLFLVILMVAIFLTRDLITRKVLEQQFTAHTGLPIKIGHAHVGIRHPEITLQHVVIYNTAEFGGSPFIDLPDLHLQYDRTALRSHQLHLELVRFNLAEVNLISDHTGRINFDVYCRRFDANTNSSNSLSHPAGKPFANLPRLKFIGIDSLDLTVNKATFRQLEFPDKIEEFKLNISHQVFPNIKTEDDLTDALFVAFLRSGVNPMQSGGIQRWLQFVLPAQK